MSSLFACVAWAVFVRYALSHPFESSYVSGTATPAVARPLAAWMFTWLPVAGALVALVCAEPEQPDSSVTSIANAIAATSVRLRFLFMWILPLVFLPFPFTILIQVRIIATLNQA
jgi:hypothetical protein